MPDFVERVVAANGQSFEVLECGEGDRLALLLHGFPSLAMCWEDQLPMLAAMGYRVWAPNLRGYGNSSRPRRAADYTIDALLGDIAGLIDASGARSIVLVGHDWGGLLAWFFAARRMRKIDRLIILNAPHPALAAVAYRRWRQMRKAWYMLAFQVPWLPDRLLGFNNGWGVGRLMIAVAGGRPVFTPEKLMAYRRAAAAPGATTAMLNWYRGMLRGGVPVELTGRFPAIETPTLVIWGDDDVALDTSCIDGVEAHVPNVVLRHLAGVCHWVQEQEPETVNELIRAFLSEEAPSPR